MPKVGTKTFPYTPEGEGQAEVYAAQTGQPITREEKDSFGYGSYQGGGLFSGAEQRASAGDVMGSSGLFSGAEQRESINEYALNTAFKTAIQRELNPPKDQGHDRHLDNLKAIRAYALKNPEHFYQFMNMEEKSGDLKRLKDNLTKEFAKYGSDDINNLMWGSDEWEMDQEGMQRGGPVKDQFGYGSYQEGGSTMEVSWDDPWGDNISIPHRNGEVVTGPEADEYSPFGGQGFESILYKGHTFQEIDTDQYNKEDIDKAIAWYQEAGQKTSDYIDKYSDDPKVMAAQERKMKEIQFMLQQLAGGQNASAMIQRGGFAGKFGY